MTYLESSQQSWSLRAHGHCVHIVTAHTNKTLLGEWGKQCLLITYTRALDRDFHKMAPPLVQGPSRESQIWPLGMVVKASVKQAES